MTQNTEVVLRRIVQSSPVADDFELVERPIPTPGDGELLIRTVQLSLDPYIGGRLRSRHMGEKAPAPGQSLPGSSVGQIVKSRHPDFADGEYVVGECGWAEFGIMQAKSARKIDASLPLSAHLGVLGMPGLTAWAGITQLAQIVPGDIFSVDAAAGSVGGTAGQIARRLGAKVVGIAGGSEKCAVVTGSYGFDACIDYRAPDWVDAYVTACDGGPTAHFENVGLSVLMPVMRSLKLHGRVVLCGLAEHYQAELASPEMPVGIIVGKRARMLGLVVYDYFARWNEWVTMARPWIEDGSLVFHEDSSDGIASAPQQFERLMLGKNIGKTLVRIGPDAA